MMVDNLNEQALKLAESWIGTPYRHQGAKKQIGCDCLGLIRGIWRELYGQEPEAPPTYSRSWAEVAQGEPLLDACKKWFKQEENGTVDQPGKLLVFRWHKGSAAKHLGILSDPNHFIHAYSGQSVLKSPLVPSWRRRIVAQFNFPISSLPII